MGGFFYEIKTFFFYMENGKDGTCTSLIQCTSMHVFEYVLIHLSFFESAIQ
jgi:hypothetical protein